MASKVHDPGSGRHGRLFDSVKVLAVTFLAIAYTRLELLSTEVEEERVRLSSIIGCRPASTSDWEAQLPRIAAIGFNLVGRRPHKFCRPGVIVGLLRPLGLWLLHRFSLPCSGHCLLNTRVPKLVRELQGEGFAMNEL